LQEHATAGGWRRWALAAALVSFVTFLPFLRGALLGNCFFFRDLSRHYFPARMFAIDGLRNGELRHWNPFVHEGEPALPVSYPLDLLQVLWPTESGVSLSLSLHVPFAALAFLLLARQLGMRPLGASLGAIVYALGGFSLSTLSLYVHLHALAWAPIVVLGLARAAHGGRRAIAAGALCAAVALSTFGVEITAQALLLGVVMNASRDPRRLGRMACSLLLGAALAAPTLLFLRATSALGARAAGFPVETVLAFSVHPLTFLQTMIAALYHDPADPLNRHWGGNFSTGFPYFISFYVGALTLALAATGAASWRKGRRLVVWSLLAAWVCLGAWGRLDLLLDILPVLRSFRYPSKAFFSLHIALALLAAAGGDALAASRRPWRSAGLASLAIGGVLVALPVLAFLTPLARMVSVGGFFPPVMDARSREAITGFILEDAATGGLVCLAIAAVAGLAVTGRLAPARATQVACAVAAADLLRAGAGLNPMVTPAFYDHAPETSALAASLGPGRIFTCDPSLGPALQKGYPAHQGTYEAWSQGVLLESLLPSFNVRIGLASAYSRDLTKLVPERYVLGGQQAGCASFDQVADRLRRAGVAHVLSVEPHDTPDLVPRAVLQPQRIAPLSLYVYELRGALPLRLVARDVRPAATSEEAESIASEPGFLEAGGAAVEGRSAAVSGAQGRILEQSDSGDELRLTVETDRATVVVVRDAWSPGWQARVNGVPAPVLRCDGRHRAVEIAPGRSEIVMSYRAPGWRAGLAIGAAALAGVTMLLLRGR